MHQAIEMALRAVGQLGCGDAGFGMRLGNFIRLVVMAGVAGVLGIRASMAGLALLISLLAVINGERMFDQHRRVPALVGVAQLALEAEESGMDLRFLVAAGAQG